MRRKSKKTKEETVSTERRSKRSSARRKRAHEDDEAGGSDVEEERVIEEEMTPAKSRGGRRYATRGRRQKAEESEEEEASQGEEDQEEEDENSNSVAIAAESASKENEAAEEYKSLKSGIAVSDKSIVSEGGDGASAWKSDKQSWGMKSNKESHDDRGEETPAQGEGDDGEEEGSRSHSRRRKLKLSRDCLQESREAIPKIRLRLSRNRSGGYETEKLEAERIETKKSEEESLVKVIKVKPIIEEKEPVQGEEVVSEEPVISEKQPEEIVCQEQAAEAAEEQIEEAVCEEQPEEVASEEKPEEAASEEQSEEAVSEEQPEEAASEEQSEEAVSEEQPEEAASEVPSEEAVSEEQPEEAASEEQIEEAISEEQAEEAISEEQAEEVVSEEQPEEEQKGESEEETEQVEVSPKESDDEEKVRTPEPEQEESEEVGGEQAEEVESKPVSPEEGEQQIERDKEEEVEEVDGQGVEEGAKVAEKSEDEEQEEESSKEASPSIPEEKLEEASSMEEKDTKSETEVDENVEAESLPISPAAKEKEEVEESREVLEAECERQETPDAQSDDGKEEEPREKQVSVDGEVSDKPIVEEAKEVEGSNESDSEKQRSDERENGDAEEGNDKSEGIDEDKKDVEVVEEKNELVKEDTDVLEGVRATECDEGKETKADVSEVIVESNKEQESRHESDERVGRISRPKVRQDEEDVSEGMQNQRRHRRRRSRSIDSNGEQRRLSTTSSTSEAAQPKRVTLKRPRLIRNVSSSSVKDATSEEKPAQEEPESKVEDEVKEEKSEDVAPAEESAQQEPKPVEDGSSAEEVIRKRRRKWGQQKSLSGPSQSKRAFISISTQSLKGLIPEVKPLPIHELRLSVEKDEAKDICMEEEESCEVPMDETIVRMIDANGQNERTVWAQVVEEERTTVHAEVARIPVVGSDGPVSSAPIRRISIVSDDATRLQRSPSPPRHPPSNVLFLSNLVRPFTVQQLKELLARTGTVAEDGFWIDRIKSMCLVQYESEEQARETRHALHGVRWPISNPKRLFVDFSTKERLEEAKREGNVPTPIPPAVAAPSLSPTHSAPRDDFPRKTEPLRIDGSGMVPVHHPVHRVTPGSPSRQAHALIRQPGAMMAGGPEAEAVAVDNVAWQQRNRPRPDAPVRPGANTRDYKLSAPVREWDLDKVVQQSPPGAGMHGPNRGPAEERRRPEAGGQASGRRDRMLPSPPPSIQEIQARKAKRKEAEAAAAAAAEAPANLLDSLFRKTKATPSIYWLPLTADQIKVKEEIRRQHLAEHERRMAEMKRASEKDRGSRRRRRSSTPRRRSRRRSGEGSSAAHKKSGESIKGHKTSSTSPKK